MRLNFATLGNSHCYEVDVVEWRPHSLVARAILPINLANGTHISSGQRFWVPRKRIDRGPPPQEIGVHPDALAVYPMTHADEAHGAC